MEPVAAFPSGLGRAECRDLAALYRRPGLFVTCYLDTNGSAEDVGRRIESRWTTMERELRQRGVGEPTIDSLARSVSGVPSLRQRAESVCVLACDGDVLLVESGPAPLDRDFAEVGPLPVLGPVIGWRQQSITYIIVLCDLAGADIVVHGHGNEVVLLGGERDRHDPLLHKAHAGGWSYPRYERRVETTWERNARDVLDVVNDLVVHEDPRLVMFGGEPRACGLLRKEAGPAVQALLEEVPLSRAPDGRYKHEPPAVRAAVERVVARDTTKLLDHYLEMKARSLGVDGPGPVLAALGASQVETLLLYESLDDEPTAYMSRDPVSAALDRDQVVAFGGDPIAARLADVALAATFLTGGRVRMVRSAPEQGAMAAVLRFSG